jgi:hypothetical protein
MSVPPVARAWIALAAAAGAFSLIFLGTSPPFWWRLSFCVVALCVFALALDSELPGALRRTRRFTGWREILLGLSSAAVLYAVFWVSNELAARWLAAAPQEVAQVYRLKTGTNPWVISLLLLGVIGPGEELFWRGYLQEQFSRRYGARGAFLAMLAYALVHAVSGNVMLILAALVCGVFWGVLYGVFRSVWVNMISHAAWTLAVFVLWPFSAPL